MARLYVLANQKGGVGKTTTVASLGGYLAEMGQRVLLIDLDPQANLTSCLGVDKMRTDLSMYDVLVGDAPFSEVVLRSARLKLWLAPSAPALAGAEVELVALDERELRLRRALAGVGERYDYVIIDCPPSLGLLTVNGLAAASGVIIPVQCEYLALEGLTQLMQTLILVRRKLNQQLSIRGMLMTMYDARTNLSQEVVNQVKKHYPGLVFRTLIPRSIRLSEAPSYGLPINVYAPRTPAGAAYRAFAEELTAGDGVQWPFVKRGEAAS
jgi:chromosome partitioning protein